MEEIHVEGMKKSMAFNTHWHSHHPGLGPIPHRNEFKINEQSRKVYLGKGVKVFSHEVRHF